MTNTADTQTRLAFHGCLVLLLGLVGGIGFSYAAAVADTSSELYRVWKFVHLEGIVNGLVVLAAAGIWHKINESAAVSAPPTPMPVNIRAANSQPTLGAKAVSAVPAVHIAINSASKRTR